MRHLIDTREAAEAFGLFMGGLAFVGGLYYCGCVLFTLSLLPQR